MFMDRIRETHVQALAYITVTDTSTLLFIRLAVCNWRLPKLYKKFSFRLIENTIRTNCNLFCGAATQRGSWPPHS
jgi:hypothetical protein